MKTLILTARFNQIRDLEGEKMIIDEAVLPFLLFLIVSFIVVFRCFLMFLLFLIVFVCKGFS